MRTPPVETNPAKHDGRGAGVSPVREGRAYRNKGSGAGGEDGDADDDEDGNDDGDDEGRNGSGRSSDEGSSSAKRW